MAQDATSAFLHAPIAVAIARADGVITRTNPALTRLLGYPEADLVGQALFRLLPPGLVAGAVAACASLQDGSADTVVHETRFTTAAGPIIDVRVTTSTVRTPTAGQPHVIMHLEDISEHVDLRRRLEHQATHDDLTGLPNRAHFLTQLQRAQARSRRHHQPLTVIYLDLDEFKAVNDTFGHGAGDRLLITFAEHLRHNIRPEDIAARLGGDEFVVLCQETTADEAALIIDRLTGPGSEDWVRKLELPATTNASGSNVPEDDVLAALRVSVGSATTTPDPVAGTDSGASSPEALLHAADQAMYAAKARSAGRR